MADLSGESTKTGIVTARPRRFVLVNKTGALPPISHKHGTASQIHVGIRLVDRTLPSRVGRRQSRAMSSFNRCWRPRWT